MRWRLLSVALLVVGVIWVGMSAPAGASTPGRAWAWGNNADGELGNGTITRYGGIASPGQVKNLTNVIAVAGGSEHTLALRSDGTVWAWGNSGWGQLGQGSYGSSTIPLRVPSLSGITAIAAGELHSLALKSDGTVWAWGYDGLGQLGNGTSNELPHSTPGRVSNLTGVVGIGAGLWHGLAVKSDGTVRAWGYNQYGQLGASTTTTCGSYQYPCSTVPVPVRNLTGVTSVAGGGNFSLALKADGTVWGWGDNGYGQLANGKTTSFGGTAVPTEASLRGVVAIAAGDNHTLALQSNGTVWAAGENNLGQLGNGTFTDSSKPVQVSGISGATAIGAGVSHSLAIGP